MAIAALVYHPTGSKLSPSPERVSQMVILKGHGFSHAVQSQNKWGFSPRGMHAFCLK
jgi:hypothetical protein